MSAVLAIATNTFKEAVRNRVLYILLFFAILMVLGAWVASTLSNFGQEKVIRDLGVGAINIISVLIAVFVGVGLVYNDLDKKTIYTIVSKPIDRWQFLLGKYLGLTLTIWVMILIMAFFFLGIMYFRQYIDTTAMYKALDLDLYTETPGALQLLGYYLWSAIKAIGYALATVVSFGGVDNEITNGIMGVTFLTMLEMAVITAFAVLFSSFTSPTLAAFLTVTSFIIGRSTEDIYFLAQEIVRRAGDFDALTLGQQIAYWFAMVVSHAAPHLETFDQRGAIADGTEPVITLYAVGYAIAYAAAVLTISVIIFNRRNFK